MSQHAMVIIEEELYLSSSESYTLLDILVEK